MKTALVIALLFSAHFSNAADCPRYCDPAKSKPCGASCISNDRQCHKSWTTSCVGVRPSGGKVFETPKFMTERPK
jgi:hypothetical protein